MTDLSQSIRHTLSIRLSADGFSFSIYTSSPEDKASFRTFRVNPQHSMAANVKEFLAQTEELGRPCRETNILIHTSRYTSVPFELYEDDQSETLFYQNLPRQNNEVILCNILGKSNVAVLFSLDKLTHQLLTDHFPQARFFASISPITEYLTIRNRQSAGHNEMYSIFHPRHVDILVFSHRRLTLVNTYRASDSSDKNYYLLDVWKQLDLDPYTDRLSLYGTRPLEETAGFLKTYIKNIHIINPRTEFTHTAMNSVHEVPFDILSLISCE